MSQSRFPRMAAFLILAAAMLAALPGCSKRLDTSNEEKYYKTLTEVVNSLPASQQQEFDNGMTTLWFYSENDDETYAKINGKTGKEIAAIIGASTASVTRALRWLVEKGLAELNGGKPKYLRFNLYHTVFIAFKIWY